MPTKTARRTAPTAAAAPLALDLPPLPSLLTQPLGLEGWSAQEPILLAALASEAPMLLIGPHGSAKSFLLERLAQVLDLEYRFYNASLLNYDDLVGIPIPDEERRGLKYIATPSAIWGAQVVFVDEINRTRPELQNKLFPIVHERRVQGVDLEGLRYRWAAMNPPPSADACDDNPDVYLGAEPLDPALADRFSFVIEVPGWNDLSDAQKRSMLRDQFRGPHDFPVPATALVESARERLDHLQAAPPAALEDYVIGVLGHLGRRGIAVSARRATMFHRNILAVHAARAALYGVSHPDVPHQVIDWSASALLALQHSLPQAAQGRPPSPTGVLAAHRQAWELSRLDTDNPWRVILGISDPAERLATALSMRDRLDDCALSDQVVGGLSAVEDPISRTTLALVTYLAVRGTRDLRATTYEFLAAELASVLSPGEFSHEPDVCERARYRQVRELCARLRASETGTAPVRDRYAANLLMALLPTGYGEVTPLQVYRRFCALWDRLGCDACEPGEER